MLRPGAAAVLVIPTGPGLYDYYDRFLHHERRYARGEMADKARGVGLRVEADLHLGSVVFSGLLGAQEAKSPPLRPPDGLRAGRAREA